MKVSSHLIPILSTLRGWLVMLGACIVGRRCFVPITAYLFKERSSFIRYHGQRARSSTRTSEASTKATSAAAGLKNDNVSEEKISEAFINDVKGCKVKDRSSSRPADTALKSHIIAKDPGAYDSNSTNGPEKLGTPSTTVLGSFPFFQSHQREEDRSTRRTAEAAYALRDTSKDLEEKKSDTAGHCFSAAQSDRYGAWVAEGTPPLPAQCFQNLGQPESREGGLWDVIGAQHEREADKPAAGVEQPIEDTLSQDSRTPQSPNNAFEAANRATTRRSRSARPRRREVDRNLTRAQSLPALDAVYLRLHNPRYDLTRPGRGLRKGSSTKNRRPEERGETHYPERRFHKAIRAASVVDIEQKLHHTAHHKPDVDGVHFMLNELIKVRNVQPQARHYEALILANCEAHHGSAVAIYPILAEMEREKVGIGASTLSAALKVLSIHPDAQLLPRIIRTFFSQWIIPSVTNTVHLILCLTRLNQFELAITHLEQLISTSPPISPFLQTPIPQYLYTTILYRLAAPAIADHTAILHLLYLLYDNNLPVSNVCISYILDSAAEALHLDLTLYLWRSHVDTNFIIPNTGLCRNALLTAERSGNPELAEKVSRWLKFRGEWGVEESEMVREAFGGLDMQLGRGLGEAGVPQTTKRIVSLRREKELQETRKMKVREEKIGRMREVGIENQVEERAQKGGEALAKTEDNDSQVEERDTDGESEVQPRFVPRLEKRRQRQRHRQEMSTEIAEEKEEQMHQERETDDEDHASEKNKTKGEFKVQPRYVAASKIYKLSPRRQRISETMKEGVGEQEREIDDEDDESEEDKTRGEFKVRRTYGAALKIYKLSPRRQRISETMQESVGEQEKVVDSEYKVEEPVARYEKAGIEDDDDDEAAADNAKPESEVRARLIRTGLKIRRLNTAAGTESQSRGGRWKT